MDVNGVTAPARSATTPVPGNALVVEWGIGETKSINGMVFLISLLVLLLILSFRWEVQETYSFRDVLANEQSIHFYFSFYVVMGVLVVVVVNLIFDYVNYRGTEHRKDLLLNMRAYLAFALICPIMAVYVGRWIDPPRTGGLFLIAAAVSASIMAYFLFAILGLSETKEFTPAYLGVLAVLVNAHNILCCINERGMFAGTRGLRVSLAVTFFVLYTISFIRYVRKIDFMSEMSVLSCTKEAIILSVAFSPFTFLPGVGFLLMNPESSKGIDKENADAAINRVTISVFCVLLQSVFLIISPERIARLLVIRMKGTVIRTANKLSNKIQPSVKLLKKTISLLKKPSVMSARHTHEFFQESYENLTIACERVLGDIEELRGDEFFELSNRGGFLPTLRTIQEAKDESVIDDDLWQEYSVIDLNDMVSDGSNIPSSIDNCNGNSCDVSVSDLSESEHHDMEVERKQEKNELENIPRSRKCRGGGNKIMTKPESNGVFVTDEVVGSNRNDYECIKSESEGGSLPFDIFY